MKNEKTQGVFKRSGRDGAGRPWGARSGCSAVPWAGPGPCAWARPWAPGPALGPGLRAGLTGWGKVWTTSWEMTPKSKLKNDMKKESEKLLCFRQ